MSPYAFDLEKALAAWRRSLEHNHAISSDDLEELEAHLRDQIRGITESGTSLQAAFDEAVREMGNQDSAESEYRKVFWGKQRRRRQLSIELVWRFAMWRSYLTIAVRQLRRRPLYAGINVMGLAVGMACCMVVMFFVQDEMRYDAYHEKGDRLYRLSTRAVLMTDGETSLVADTPFLWAPAMVDEYPEIEEYVRLSAATQVSNPWDVTYGNATFRESRLLYADPAVFDVFSWPLIQGDSKSALSRPNAIVLSESTARKYFGEADPVGKIGPLVISAFRGRSFVAIKVGGSDLPRTLAHVREVTERFAPGEAFELSFLDDDFAALYEEERRTAEVFGYVSALAIIIACLGLFGLSTYAAERRTKEIGIRKVMGASVANIVGLLSADFLKLVVLAFVFAAPAAYFIMQHWLDGFAYRTSLSAGVFLAAGLSALLIAVLSVNYQSVKAALADPVRSLRYE